MLSALGATLLTTSLAAVGALVLGWLLGLLTLEFSGIARVSARLVELRGALPTLIAAPLLDGWLHLPATCTLGLLVGASQALAVARWVRALHVLHASRSPHGQPTGPRTGGATYWAPPVRSTIALCLVHVVTLEAVLSLVELPPWTVSLGSLMAQALAPTARLGAVLTLSCLFLLLELGLERVGPSSGTP